VSQVEIEQKSSNNNNPSSHKKITPTLFSISFSQKLKQHATSRDVITWLGWLRSSTRMRVLTGRTIIIVWVWGGGENGEGTYHFIPRRKIQLHRSMLSTSGKKLWGRKPKQRKFT